MISLFFLFCPTAKSKHLERLHLHLPLLHYLESFVCEILCQILLLSLSRCGDKRCTVYAQGVQVHQSGVAAATVDIVGILKYKSQVRIVEVRYYIYTVYLSMADGVGRFPFYDEALLGFSGKKLQQSLLQYSAVGFQTRYPSHVSVNIHNIDALKEWVTLYLSADGGSRSVSGIYFRIGRQGEQFLAYPVRQQVEVASRQVGTSY